MVSLRSVPPISYLYRVHPNFYTAQRIVGVVPLIWLVYSANFAAAFVLFCVLAITDFLDGDVARATGKVTDFGKFFDPLADKIYLLAALILLLPPTFWAGSTFWLGCYVLALEGLLFETACLAYFFPKSLGQALGANLFGKLKAFSQVIFVVLLFGGLFLPPVAYYSPPVDGMMLIIAFYATLSLAGHWGPALRKLRDTRQENTG